MKKPRGRRGNRLSIERLNKLEAGIAAANQKNATNDASAKDVIAILTGVEGSLEQANDYNAETQAIIDQFTPAIILTDDWGYFDGASMTNSTASEVTRTLSGYTTRANDPALYANNGNNISILQPGTYLVMRSARVAASDGYWSTLDGQSQMFMYGGGSNGYRIMTSISSVDIVTVTSPGYAVGITVTLGGGSGITLSGSEGKIAIQKIA